VGVAGFVVDSSVLFCACTAPGSACTAALVSYLAAASATWYLNRRITFADRSPPAGSGRASSPPMPSARWSTTAATARRGRLLRPHVGPLLAWRSARSPASLQLHRLPPLRLQGEPAEPASTAGRAQR